MQLTAFTWLFLGFWWYSFIIFPSWYIFPPDKRIYVLSFFILYFLLNAWLIQWWMGKNFGKPIIWRGWRKNLFKRNLGLVILLLLAIFLQLYPMTLPIETGGDEHYHSYVSIPFLEASSRILNLPYPQLGWLLILILGGIIWGGRKFRSRVRKIPSTLLIGALVFSSLIYFYFLNSLNLADKLGPIKHLVRFPPLGKTANLLFYSLFGISEFTARLPQLVFYLLGAIFIYRLGILFRNRTTAFWGAGVFLFLPPFFYYGHMAYLTSGVIFLVLSAIYYFLRYLKEGEKRDFILAVFLTSMGFLYKRLLLALFLSFFLYLLIARLMAKEKAKFPDKLSFYIKAFWMGLVPVIPWMYLGYKFGERNYAFILSRWTSWETTTLIIRQMPQAVTYPISFLLLGALIHSLIRKRDALTLFLFFWVIAYYVFITSDSATNIRLSLPLYGGLVILLARVLGNGERYRKLLFPLYSLLLIYLMLVSLGANIPPLNYRYTLRTNIQQGYLPYPQAFQYIKKNIPPGSKIFAPMGCEPSHFYLALYRMKDDYPWYRKFDWADSAEKQNLNNLYIFAKNKGFQYVLFPRGDWLKPWINVEMVEELFRGKDERFPPIKIFQYGRNEIILCRLR